MNKQVNVMKMLLFLVGMASIGLTQAMAAGGGNSAAASASAAGATARAATGAQGIGNSSPSGFAPSIGGGNSVGSGSSAMGVGNATAVGGGYEPTGPGASPAARSGYSSGGAETYSGSVLIGTPTTASSQGTENIDVQPVLVPVNNGGDSSSLIDPDSAQ